MNQYHFDYERNCPNCGRQFTAKRLNQGYCSSHCRIQFNNHKAKTNRDSIHELTGKTNAILLKNRNILARYHGKGEIGIDSLVRAGFKLNYITFFDMTDGNENRLFVYDFYYIFVDNKTINISRA